MTRLDGGRTERRYAAWVRSGEAVGRVLRRLIDKLHHDDRWTDTPRSRPFVPSVVRIEYATRERRPRRRMR